MVLNRWIGVDACQHRATQPQARTRHRYPGADLETSQFAPAQPGQRQNRHHIAVRARAGQQDRPFALLAAARMAVSGRPGYALRHYGRGEAPVMAGPDKKAAGRGRRAGGADHRTAVRLIVLGAVVHMLRSRRFYQRLITVTIALGAVGQIGREDEASTMARLAAWDKRQIQRVERKAKRQGQVIKGAGQMMRSGAPRHLTGRDGT